MHETLIQIFLMKIHSNFSLILFQMAQKCCLYIIKTKYCQNSF
eukprot:UN00536